MSKSQDLLWAPWRIGFLGKPKSKQCIFCTAKKAKDKRRVHVIEKTSSVFALLNKFPYNNGHIMIAPLRHIGLLSSVTKKEWTDIFDITKSLTRRLDKLLKPQGYNIGFNIGRVAGAGIPGHIHLHIVPRWGGDTNFMPIIGDTKVIAQSLDELYFQLVKNK